MLSRISRAIQLSVLSAFISASNSFAYSKSINLGRPQMPLTDVDRWIMAGKSLLIYAVVVGTLYVVIKVLVCTWHHINAKTR